jgi:EpsI family protein
MTNPLTKIGVAFAMLALFGAGTFYMYYTIGRLKGIEMPARTLAECPKTIGPWKGEEHPMDERTFRVTQCSEVLSRSYTDLAAKEVTLHMGTYSNFWNDVPHAPVVCYVGSGWVKEATSPETIKVPDAPPLNIMFVTFEMEGRTILVGYWYQLGDLTFSDDSGLRAAQKQLRDCKEWPAIVKVLLQTDAGNRDQAKKRLTEFASRVYEWSSRMQRGDAVPSSGNAVAPPSVARPSAAEAGTR